MPDHKTVSVQVWVDVDEGIASFVSALNRISGVRTHSSCQGTLGEGGAEPYGPYVVVSWDNATALAAVLQIATLDQDPNIEKGWPNNWAVARPTDSVDG